jgi:hypothetical protein
MSFGNNSCSGSLGSYGYGAYQSSFQAPIGLAGYGQSVSSEGIDCNVGSYPQYGAVSVSNASSPYSTYPPQPYSSYPQVCPPCPPCPPCPAPVPAQSCCPLGQLDLNDPQLLQQVDQIVASLTECKRPMLRRQVITVPACCPPRIANITRRLPTPPPDIIERITVVKPPRDVVNLCIEKPLQPGPCYQQREVCGKPRKPIIQPRIIPVPPRSAQPPPVLMPSPTQPVCPPCPPCPPCNSQCPPCPPCPPCPASQAGAYIPPPPPPPQSQYYPMPQQPIQMQCFMSQPQVQPSYQYTMPNGNAFYGASFAGYQC